MVIYSDKYYDRDFLYRTCTFEDSNKYDEFKEHILMNSDFRLIIGMSQGWEIIKLYDEHNTVLFNCPAGFDVSLGRVDPEKLRQHQETFDIKYPAPIYVARIPREDARVVPAPLFEPAPVMRSTIEAFAGAGAPIEIPPEALAKFKPLPKKDKRRKRIR